MASDNITVAVFMWIYRTVNSIDTY